MASERIQQPAAPPGGQRPTSVIIWYLSVNHQDQNKSLMLLTDMFYSRVHMTAEIYGQQTTFLLEIKCTKYSLKDEFTIFPSV